MASKDSEQRLEALNNCLVCEIDLTGRAADLRNSPEFLARMVHLIHARLEKSTAHVAMLGRLDSFERVAYFLAEMAAHNPARGAVVTLPMSREDIADYLGLNTGSISRLLSRIRKSGVVRFISHTEYTVPDFDSLARRIPVAFPGALAAPTASGGLAQ